MEDRSCRDKVTKGKSHRGVTGLAHPIPSQCLSQFRDNLEALESGVHVTCVAKVLQTSWQR